MASFAVAGVYPRERGGTHRQDHVHAVAPGLSPRTRGNPGRWWTRPAYARSIPANAGEPLPVRRAMLLCGVYPRERGGTAAGKGDSE